jgi:predicted dehydrogenase
VDICNWMVESRASRVASFGGLDFFTPENQHHQERIGPNKDGKEAYASWPRSKEDNPFTAEKDIIDNQVCIVEFENKVRATFHTNLNAGIPERRIYILGTEGAIRADLITGTIETARIGWERHIESHKGEHKGGHGGGDEILVEHLYKMMAEDAPSLTSLDAGIDAAVTCYGFQDAMNAGTVVDMRRYWQVLERVPAQV